MCGNDSDDCFATWAWPVKTSDIQPLYASTCDNIPQISRDIRATTPWQTWIILTSTAMLKNCKSVNTSPSHHRCGAVTREILLQDCRVSAKLSTFGGDNLWVMLPKACKWASNVLCMWTSCLFFHGAVSILPYLSISIPVQYVFIWSISTHVTLSSLLRKCHQSTPKVRK